MTKKTTETDLPTNDEIRAGVAEGLTFIQRHSIVLLAGTAVAGLAVGTLIGLFI